MGTEDITEKLSAHLGKVMLELVATGCDKKAAAECLVDCLLAITTVICDSLELDFDALLKEARQGARAVVRVVNAKGGSA